MASKGLNRVFLIGNLVRDAETSHVGSGTAITKFSVATNRRWKDQASGEWKEEAQFTNCVMWRGENLAPHLTRGKQVHIEGRIQTRSYDDKEGRKVWVTEVIVDEAILLGGGSGRSDAEEPREPRAQRSDYIGNDDCPF